LGLDTAAGLAPLAGLKPSVADTGMPLRAFPSASPASPGLRQCPAVVKIYLKLK